MAKFNDYLGDKFRYSHEITENPDPNFFVMHAHDVCEFYYFISGKAQYLVEGNVYDLKSGDIMIMRQGETHKLQILGECIYDRISVHFSPLVIYETFSKDIMRPFYSHPLGRMNLYRREDFDSDYYLACINKIKRAIDEKRQDEHIIAPFIALLLEISQAHKKRDKTTSQLEKSNLATEIADYINEHLFENLSLPKIAENFYISHSQANRVFKKYIGSSIWDYVIIKRLVAAKEMLEKGLTARETAEKCGFSDYSSFYRAYKKKFGVNPKR